jgi:hypothetical protein
MATDDTSTMAGAAWRGVVQALTERTGDAGTTVLYLWAEILATMLHIFGREWLIRQLREQAALLEQQQDRRH